MTAPPRGVHRKAVETAVRRAGGRTFVTANAPLTELLRVLADQMDASETPSARLLAAYLSCLKDFQRAINGTPKTKTRTSNLARLRGVPRPKGHDR